MKLATLHDGSRDGQLIVVSRDLATAHLASHIAGSLQRVLDDWNFLSPQLEDLYAVLNGGKARHAFAFDPAACLAPLPRAFLWSPDGVNAARADAFRRPVGDLPSPAADCAVQAQLVAMTGDVAPDADPHTALDGVRLLLLAASWTAGGSVLATAFCPLAATPEELGSAWPPALRPARSNASGNGNGSGQSEPAALTPETRRESRPRAGLQRLLAAPLDGDAPGLGQRIAALAQRTGLIAGSLVGGPAFDAGAGWQPGQRLTVQLMGTDAASAFGLLSVQCPALPEPSDAQPAAPVAALVAPPEPAAAPAAAEPGLAPEPAA